MNSTKEIVLITGGCGYIGNFISEKLVRKNYQVVLYDLRPPQEVTDKENISYFQVITKHIQTKSHIFTI